jgi:hypothetical protein
MSNATVDVNSMITFPESFELIKQYDTQVLSPSPELINVNNNSINIQTVTERVKFIE